MNMVQKTYPCEAPTGQDPTYEVYAWQAMGSKAVNYRLKDSGGWIGGVFTEYLGRGPNSHLSDMDSLIAWLYWVVKD